MGVTTLTEEDRDEIAALFVGRRVVQAEKGRFDLPDGESSWRKPPEGRLVLDDGTVLLLTGHEGGCSCGAGDYDLEKVAAFDNVITSAAVHCSPSGDDEHGDGTYRIFVFADATAMQVAEFVGSDGNGYYGTGFALTVVPAPTAAPAGGPARGSAIALEDIREHFARERRLLDKAGARKLDVDAITDAFVASYGLWDPDLLDEEVYGDLIARHLTDRA